MFTHVDVKGGRGFVGGRVYLGYCCHYSVSWYCIFYHSIQATLVDCSDESDHCSIYVYVHCGASWIVDGLYVIDVDGLVIAKPFFSIF